MGFCITQETSKKEVDNTENYCGKTFLSYTKQHDDGWNKPEAFVTTGKKGTFAQCGLYFSKFSPLNHACSRTARPLSRLLASRLNSLKINSCSKETKKRMRRDETVVTVRVLSCLFLLLPLPSFTLALLLLSRLSSFLGLQCETSNMTTTAVLSYEILSAAGNMILWKFQGGFWVHDLVVHFGVALSAEWRISHKLKGEEREERNDRTKVKHSDCQLAQRE